MDGSVAGVLLPVRTTRLSRPVIGWRVPAGFPSPAEDYVEGRIDLSRDLVRHPLATYYVRVDGDSMEPLIRPGALLLVDRMVEAAEGDIVVARVGDELCVKRLHMEESGQIRLLSENSAYGLIVIAEEVDFEVWGRVMYSIEQH